MKKIILCKLFEFTEKTLYNWTKEKRPIISLLETYFQQGEVEEYLNTGAIKKFELIKDISVEELEKLLKLKFCIDTF